jgi:adenylate kinase family enzyme
MHVLVTGAAGSGTSTLGEALASRWNAHFLDADSCYWQPTNPPFVQKRSPEERSRLLCEALQDHSSCVVAGSVMGWGAEVEDAFSLIIFLYVPTEVRLQRLEQREVQLFGEPNPTFLEWASQYDSGLLEGRSLARHNVWLATRQCQVVRFEGNHSVAELLSALEQLVPSPFIEGMSSGELRSASHVKPRRVRGRPR